ncbi:hypothetical protein OHA25_08710 [Nonomuraea sp. NBC_00507]|uniref:hypothetical protein n=1 Tax=Nonomuraea sp. NBC_00507 TaxID=2976002 RepID=UPI002E19764D
MPLPKQDSPARRIDERPRTYRITTPRRTCVVVELGGSGDPVKIKVSRRLDMVLGMNTAPVLDLSQEEAWAIWAALCDGLGAGGEPPDWTNGPLTAFGPDGAALPALPTAAAAEPF